jgi:tetratricopeptide (TPR) repeat protein
MPGLMRLQTETSETFSKSNLLKSLSIYDSENTELKVEESLVIHYISIVIRLLKLSDGMKAIQEYRKKKGLSKRASAHLYKLEGLLALLSEKKEYDEAKKCFHESLKLFHKINSAKGKAICRLALVRIQCESEHKNNVEHKSTKQLVSIVEKAQQQFEKIDYERGIKRAECYVNILKNKLLSETDNIVSTFAKLKTLKQSSILKKTDKLHLEDTVLNDEDILLFTEIIENDEFKLGMEKRHVSCSIQRPSINSKCHRLLTNKNSQNNLSLSIKTSKFHKRSTMLLRSGKKKRFIPNSRYLVSKRLGMHMHKKSVIILDKSPSLFHQESTDTN